MLQEERSMRTQLDRGPEAITVSRAAAQLLTFRVRNRVLTLLLFAVQCGLDNLNPEFYSDFSINADLRLKRGFRSQAICGIFPISLTC